MSALAGCALGPDYQRPELPLPPAWRAPLVDAADVANTAWWEAIGDEDLNALIKTALDANKDLQLATLRVEEFDARLQVSRAGEYPQVGYGASGKRQRFTEERPSIPQSAELTQNVFEMSLNVGWELDLWGRVRRSNEAARADLLATEEARRAVMLTVVTNVATSYVELIGLDQQLALTRQSLKNREDSLALIDTKYKGGSGTRLSVAQARAAVDELAVAIPDIERQIALLENALSALLGRNPGPIQRRTIDALVLPPVPQGVPSDVLARRPDVLAAEQSLIAANARIGVAKTQYLPSISLTSVLGLASDELKWLLERTARTGEIGAGLVGTLFSAGRIEGDVRQTEAVHKQMVVTYQKAVQTALREVEDALVFRAKANEQLAATGRFVESMKEVESLSRMRYEGGYSGYLEVLDAERELYSAQLQQAQGHRDTYLALISIYKAMGGGWMVEQDKLRANAAVAVAPVDVREPGAIHEEIQK